MEESEDRAEGGVLLAPPRFNDDDETEVLIMMMMMMITMMMMIKMSFYCISFLSLLCHCYGFKYKYVFFLVNLF